MDPPPQLYIYRGGPLLKKVGAGSGFLLAGPISTICGGESEASFRVLDSSSSSGGALSEAREWAG